MAIKPDESSLRQRLSEQLQCSICLDQYSEPKLLPCHHAFCLKCIEGLLTTTTAHGQPNKKQRFIKCPSCCKRFQVPKGGPKKLPTDFRINSLLDLETADNSAANYHQDEREVLQRCHYTTSGSSTDAPPDDCVMFKVEEEERCPKHDQELQFYCETCQEVVCRTCSRAAHLDHVCMHITACYEKQVGELETQLRLVRKKIAGLDKARIALDKTEDDLLSQERLVQDEINEHAHKLIEEIRQSQRKLQNLVKDTAQRKKHHLSLQKEETEKCLEQLHACESTIDETLKMRYLDRALVLKKKKDIMKEAMLAGRCQPATFVPMEEPNISLTKCSPNSKSIGTLQSVELGEITLTPALKGSYITNERVQTTLKLKSRPNENSSVMESTWAEKPLVLRLSESLLNSQKSSNENKPFVLQSSQSTPVSCFLISPDGSDCTCSVRGGSANYIISFTLSKIGKYQLTVKVGGIEIPDSPFSFQAVLSPQMKSESVDCFGDLSQLRRPTSIAVFTNGNLVVAERDAHCLSMFKKEQERSSSYFYTRISGQMDDMATQIRNPHGLAIYQDAFIFVTDRDDWNRCGRLLKLSATGQLIKQVSRIYFKGTSKYLVDPKGVAVDNINGKVFVADMASDCIQVFNNDLGHLLTIERYSLFAGSLNKPYDVAVDEKGFLYVSLMGANCVVKLDQTGWFQARFDSTGTAGFESTGWSEMTSVQPIPTLLKERFFGAEVQGGLKGPTSVATSHNYLYISERKANRVSVFDISSQNFVCFMGKSMLYEPSCIAADDLGTLYVCDGQKVSIF